MIGNPTDRDLPSWPSWITEYPSLHAPVNGAPGDAAFLKELMRNDCLKRDRLGSAHLVERGVPEREVDGYGSFS